MALDKIILYEIKRIATRYRYLKSLSVKKEGMDELNKQNIRWIKKVCESEGYDSKNYIDNYNEGLCDGN